MDQYYPCPVCGFYTIDEGYYGTYSICKICGWEDDGVQLANPACGGGANREPLIEAQGSALRKIGIDVIEMNGVRRDPKWRPLSELEKERFADEAKEHYWKNPAIVEYAQTYWVKESCE